MAGKQKVDMVKMKCMSVRLGPHGEEGSCSAFLNWAALLFTLILIIRELCW